MNVEGIVRRMAAMPAMVEAMVSGLTEEEWRWNPEHAGYPGGAWSVLEIVCHLCDEEVEDFRTRVGLTLRDAAAAWPGIDPEGWARERGYNGRELRAEVERLGRERAASVAWLRALPRGTDWGATHHHPKFGGISAGDLLTAWGAHDALHLRQVSKRLWELAQRDGAGYSARYAGEWGV